MRVQKLKFIFKFITFKDFSLFETFFFINFFFKHNIKQVFFKCFFKKKIKKLIILKSPFVNKKARNQLGFIFYKGKIILDINYKTINYFIFCNLQKFLKLKILQNKIFFNLTAIHIGYIF